MHLIITPQKHNAKPDRMKAEKRKGKSTITDFNKFLSITNEASRKTNQ